MAPAGYAAVKLRTYFYPDHPSLDPAQQALQISTSAWGDGWSTNCSAVGVCGSGYVVFAHAHARTHTHARTDVFVSPRSGWRLRGNYMDSGLNIGSVDSYVSLNLTVRLHTPRGGSLIEGCSPALCLMIDGDGGTAEL